MKKKIALIGGARPNFMKVAPIHKAFQKYNSNVKHLICHTGQHYDKKMLVIAMIFQILKYLILLFDVQLSLEVLFQISLYGYNQQYKITKLKSLEMVKIIFRT